MLDDRHLSGDKLRTPAAAAVAGILFALLYGTSYVMLLRVSPAIEFDSGVWLIRSEKEIAHAMALMPFSGIAFLWFMGVVRDRLGHLEDQFFSTLFLGSGLLYVGSVFTGAAIAGGVSTLSKDELELILDNGLYLTLRNIMEQITSVYGIRMAGMFMFVLGTIWARTGIMHPWMIAITWALALILLFGMSYSHWVIMVFPCWVMMVSLFILLLNYRLHRANRKASDGVTADE